MNTVFQKLVGKTIHSFMMNVDNNHIKFVTNSGDFHYFCEADCCSTSWIEHIMNVEFLVNAKILSVEVNGMDGGRIMSPIAIVKDVLEETDTKDEYIQYYGWNFHTNKGTFSIEMRNSSNGYYGGDITEYNPDNFIIYNAIINDF